MPIRIYTERLNPMRTMHTVLAFTCFLTGGFTYIFQGPFNQEIIPIPDSKVHGADMGPIWGRQDPGGPHAGPMNLAIWDHKSNNMMHKIDKIGLTWSLYFLFVA